MSVTASAEPAPAKRLGLILDRDGRLEVIWIKRVVVVVVTSKIVDAGKRLVFLTKSLLDVIPPDNISPGQKHPFRSLLAYNLRATNDCFFLSIILINISIFSCVVESHNDQ